jgi:hypothetical protein
MAPAPKANFEENIFINCPFDDEYLSLLHPLLFTILSLNFEPRIASEREDSGEQRVDKICELIESSKYSIHDLSRLKSAAKNEFYRLNMPFELGIDYGSRKLAGKPFNEKRFLILEKEQHDFAKAISDLSGVDIKKHNNEPSKVVQVVRNWIADK